MQKETTNPKSTEVSNSAWLQALMLRDAGRWSSRLGALMLWLKTLGRGRRRQFARLSAGVCASASGVALLALLAGPMAPPVAAATITADGTTCTLIDAIKAANTDTGAGGCAAGSGADTIILNVDRTYTTAFAADSHDSALPDISSPIVIQASSGTKTITLNPAVDADLRAFFVAPGGDLTLQNINITGGQMRFGYGGHIRNEGDLTIDGGTFSNGYAGESGGSIYQYSENGQMTITGTTFSGNSARAGGGVARIQQGNATISDTVMTGNDADEGGALFVSAVEVTITNSNLEANRSLSSGGALFLDYNATVTIEGSSLVDNESDKQGGAILALESSLLDISQSLLSGNIAKTDDGGAIYAYGTVYTTNTTFSDNRADDGGAINVAGGTTFVVHSTFVGNFAASYGGAIYTISDEQVAILGSIISGNSTPSIGHELYTRGGTIPVYYSVIGDNAKTSAQSFNAGVNLNGTGNFVATSDSGDPTPLSDIVEATLADNGGRTLSHNLVTGSVAFDLVPDCLVDVDQRGEPRPQNNGCDAGAIEGKFVESAAFISTWAPGTIISGNETLTYNQLDILAWDGESWMKWFDGIDAGLNPDAYKPGSRWKHNINAMSISDVDAGDVYMSFTQNDEPVPDIPGRVDGMDVVFWDGEAQEWELIFKGSLKNIGLNNKTQEKIDGLHVLAAAPEWSEFAADDCELYFLLSTQGPGLVPKPGNIKPKNVLKFGGEDVLGFCATNLGGGTPGATTTGFWEMVLDGSAQGVVRNNIDSISMNDDETVMYVTSKRAFGVDDAFGGHSMVFAFDMNSETFDGPYLRFMDDLGINPMVDALHVMGELQLP